MAILSRLTGLTSLSIDAEVSGRDVRSMMRVASRDCRLRSVSLGEDVDADYGEPAGVGPVLMPIQHLSVGDVSPRAMSALSIDTRFLRSLCVAADMFDFAVVETVIASASHLCELELGHYNGTEPPEGAGTGRCIIAPCASQLLYLRVQCLGSGFLQRSLASLTSLIVLDAPFNAVQPSTWLNTPLPRLRVLHIAEPDALTGDFDDTEHEEVHPAVVLAAAIAGGTVWHALQTLYYSRQWSSPHLCDSASARPTAALLSDSLKVWHRFLTLLTSQLICRSHGVEYIEREPMGYDWQLHLEFWSNRPSMPRGTR